MTKIIRQSVVDVVIPAYRVKDQILDVLIRMPDLVRKIYVVDDACPDGSGDHVEAQCRDSRVIVLRNNSNLGVGGAVLTGYSAALKNGADIVIKVDGDGQMDPSLIYKFVAPIAEGRADYTKGNRFFDIRALTKMPVLRLIGNAGLSFMSKFSTGYWNIFDPTNGYTAIGRSALSHLPLEKISKRYFFETDILFRLNSIRAVVRDVPMDAVYGDEKSSLRIGRALPEFAFKHGINLVKRIFYNYFLRDFSIASVELVLGSIALGFGTTFGLHEWHLSISTGEPSTAGTVMISALSLIMGMQFLLAFLAHDISSVPRDPLDP